MAFNTLLGKTDTANGAEPRVDPKPSGPTVYIDPGAELTGTLRSKGTVRIDGRVRGEIHCDQGVIIGVGGQVHASIEAETALIAGLVEGNIVARHKITLSKTARVKGDLSTPGIVIEEGAKLRGRIVIGSEEELEADAKAEAQAKAEADAKSREAEAKLVASAAAAPPTEARRGKRAAKPAATAGPPVATPPQS